MSKNNFIFKGFGLCILASMVWLSLADSALAGYVRTPSDFTITYGDQITFEWSGDASTDPLFTDWDTADPAVIKYGILISDYNGEYQQVGGCQDWPSQNSVNWSAFPQVGEYTLVNVVGFSGEECTLEQVVANGAFPFLEYDSDQVLFEVVTPNIPIIALGLTGTTTCVISATSMDCTNTSKQDYDYTLMIALGIIIFICSAWFTVYVTKN